MSTDITDTLLHELNYVGTAAVPTDAGSGFSFALDFDSRVVWPDLPFDTASPASHLPVESRPLITATLATAERIFRTRAPKAWAFVNAHLDIAMIRQSPAVDGASSSSNRELVGYCLLTNLHIPPDRVPICLEALVHETIHQFLYRIELMDGNFCDLSDPGTVSLALVGQPDPAALLIHASFVWYGLLTLWCQLGESVADPDEASSLRGRVAPTLFGFAFVRELLDAPAFPRAGVQPRVMDLIHHMAEVASVVARSASGYPTVAAALRSAEAGQWVPLLNSGLARIGSSWQ